MLNICAITAIIIIMIAIIIVISSDGVGSSTVTILSPICKERAILKPTHSEG